MVALSHPWGEIASAKAEAAAIASSLDMPPCANVISGDTTAAKARAAADMTKTAAEPSRVRPADGRQRFHAVVFPNIVPISSQWHRVGQITGDRNGPDRIL